MSDRIVFLDVDPEDVPSVQNRFPEAEILEGVHQGEQLIAACQGAKVVSSFIHTQWPADVVQQLPDLKLLCTRSVGFNHIDLQTCETQGITVCNVPDYGSHVIAEHVFALLLSKVRHIPEGDARVESGEFDYHGLRGVSLRGKTIGIVGTGKIGRKVAQIAHGFGMHILAVDMCRVMELEDILKVEYVELPELLERSDIVTLHVPATKETTHMLNEETIKHMKDGAILINTARGELIDSQALFDALNTNKIQYALLDVLEHETNFAENEKLIDHPNVVVTPHIAFYAEESMSNMYEDCFESIRLFLAGDQPEHIVKPVQKVCDMPGISS